MLALIFLIACPFFIWGAYKNVRLSKESTAWPVVPGVVTASETTKVAWRLQPKISYSYSVNGKAYSSTQVTLAKVVPAKETAPTLSKYPVSQTVNVHYQPGNPAVAVLEAGPNRHVSGYMYYFIYLFGIVLFVNVAYFAVAIWSAQHGDSDTPSAPTYDTKTTTAAADPEQGNRLLRADADKGDAQDQMYVGMWYLAGEHGYTKDPVEAAKWFQKSADQGNAQGENMLANLYAMGTGVAKDPAKAIEWLQKAAAQNEPHACVGLGHAYEKGYGGLPQDNAKAIEWYRKAGDDPHAKEALQRLGAP